MKLVWRKKEGNEKVKRKIKDVAWLRGIHGSRKSGYRCRKSKG
jgi:hypothetical protein